MAAASTMAWLGLGTLSVCNTPSPLVLHCGRGKVHDAFVVVGAAEDEGAATWVFDVHKVIFFHSLMAANARRKDFTFDFTGDEDDNQFLPLEIHDHVTSCSPTSYLHRRSTTSSPPHAWMPGSAMLRDARQDLRQQATTHKP